MGKKKVRKISGTVKSKSREIANENSMATGVFLSAPANITKQNIIDRTHEGITQDLHSHFHDLTTDKKSKKILANDLIKKIPPLLSLITELSKERPEDPQGEAKYKASYPNILKKFDLILEAFFTEGLLKKTIDSNNHLKNSLKELFTYKKREAQIFDTSTISNIDEKSGEVIGRIIGENIHANLSSQNKIDYNLYKSLFRHYTSNRDDVLPRNILIKVAKHFIDENDIEGINLLFNYYQREIAGKISGAPTLSNFLGKIRSEEDGRTILIYSIDKLVYHKSIDLVKFIYEACKENVNEKDYYGRNFLTCALLQVAISFYSKDSEEFKLSTLHLIAQLLIDGANIDEIQAVDPKTKAVTIDENIIIIAQNIKYLIEKFNIESLEDFNKYAEISLSQNDTVAISTKEVAAIRGICNEIATAKDSGESSIEKIRNSIKDQLVAHNDLKRGFFSFKNNNKELIEGGYLDLAIKCEKPALLKYLLEEIKIDPDVKDGNNLTALYKTSLLEEDYYEYIDLLLENGADPNLEIKITAEDGKDIEAPIFYHLAKNGAKNATMMQLSEHGADALYINEKEGRSVFDIVNDDLRLGILGILVGNARKVAIEQTKAQYEEALSEIQPALSKENERAELAIIEKEKLSQELGQKITKLENEITQLTRESSSYKTQISDLRSNFHNQKTILEEQIQSLKGQIDEKQQNFEQAIAAEKKISEDLKENLTKTRSELEKERNPRKPQKLPKNIQEEVLDLKSKNSKLDTKLSQLSAEIGIIEEKNEELKKGKSELENKINELEARNSNAQKESSANKMQLIARSLANEELIKKLKTEKSEAEAGRSAAEKKSATEERKAQIAKEMNSALETAKAGIIAARDNLGAENANLRGQLESLGQDLASAIAYNATLQLNISEQTSIIERFHTENVNLKAMLELQNQHLQQATFGFNQSNSQNHHLTQEVTRLNILLAKSQEETPNTAINDFIAKDKEEVERSKNPSTQIIAKKDKSQKLFSPESLEQTF